MRLRGVLRGMGLVVFVLAGVVGGVAGFLIARGSTYPWVFPESHPVLAPLRSFVAVAAIAGGVLIGSFLAILVLSWAPGRSRCPRCGTIEVRGVTACRACGLPFV